MNVKKRQLKTLYTDGKGVIRGVINAYWTKTADYPEWKKAVLTIIFKGKGKASDPNNHRGVALQDAIMKLLSAVISKRILTKVVKTEGIEEQFGSQPGRGCREALFTIRQALQLRRYHNLPTWVLFVDLVKAFDTANHPLLMALLATYGVPEEMVDVIQRLYTDSQLSLKIGKEKQDIPYTVGVKQGDNMAPVLFLFLMQAMAETLEAEWLKEGIKIPEFRYHKETKCVKGRMRAQSTKAKGTAFSLFKILYVDDGAFMFESKKDMVRGANVVKAHFARFGLIMHHGTEKAGSKTEAIYFPPALNSPVSDGSSDESRTEGLDGFEDDEANFDLKTGGYISYTKEFKYLGSIITQDLRDNTEIEGRIKKGQAAVAALINVWRNPHIDLWMKKQLYIALPLSIALWGCESWTLTAENQRKLNTFHHKAIRKILNITMFEVEEKKITNEEVRRKLGGIKNIDEFIRQRGLDTLATQLRLPDSRLPKKLVTAWICNPRRPNQPQKNLRATYADHITEVIPGASKEGILSEWAHLAREKATWDRLIGKKSHGRQTEERSGRDLLERANTYQTRTSPPLRHDAPMYHWGR